jgi:nitrogen fixation protein
MLSIRLYKKIKLKNGWENDKHEISEDTNQSNSNN